MGCWVREKDRLEVGNLERRKLRQYLTDDHYSSATAATLTLGLPVLGTAPPTTSTAPR